MKRKPPPVPDPGHGQWVVWVSTDDAQTWRQVGRPRARHEARVLGRNMQIGPSTHVMLTRLGERPH